MPRSREIACALAGAAPVVAIELGAVRASPLSIAPLVLALALVAGAVWHATERLAARVRRRTPRAFVRASGSLVALFPLLAHLFDGGHAHTLAVARAGWLVAPLAGWLIVASACMAGELLPALAAPAAALGLAAVEFANRRFYPTEYADLHLLLTVASICLAMIAARAVVRRPLPVGIAAAVVLALFVADLRFGFRSNASRWAIATRGVDARQLVRWVRARIDLDGDGYSAVLGGPDCDDLDARIHPRAVDIPGDGIDQDCDGADAVVVTPLAAPPAASRPVVDDRAGDVILITVDALRGDLLDDNADDRRDFPHIFSLFDQGLVFSRAFATSAATDISLPSLVSGKWDPFTRISATLPELMRRSGRATHAVLPTEALRWVGETTITRGLDAFDRLVNDAGEEDVGSYTTSAKTTELGLAFLAASPPRTFLWLHYFDVHEHNEIDDDDRDLVSVAGEQPLGRAAKYRALLMLVDREVGKVHDALVAAGRWDSAIVVFTADHGESLGEDPRFPDAHGEYVYDALTRVPLAVRAPGVAPGRRADPVSIVDVLPTIAALVGRSAPDGADGRSLLDAPVPRTLLLADSAQYAVIAWPWKLLVRPDDNLTELYDIAADYDEKNDLAAANPDEVRALAALAHPLKIDRSLEGRRSREEAARALLPPPP